MTQNDHRGLALTGATDNAIALYEKAIGEFQCYSGDPVASIDAALADSPDFSMAHILRAYLFITGSDARGLEDVRAVRRGLDAAPGDNRARMHGLAIDAFLAGEFKAALERLEDILILWPRDVVALQTAHVFDFLLGDARNLRDRVARRLSAWTTSDPGYHVLIGMHAFGLEECNDYARAEERGHEALALNPRDCWAHHAVAHVLEMQERRDEGIRWMNEREVQWAHDNFFCVHNWWHLALYHLEQGDHARVLELYDGPVQGGQSDAIMDMIDASALLWRLKLRNIDVGDRWHGAADIWQPVAEDGYYAFNDVHAVMALIADGRMAAAARTVIAMERTIERGVGSNVAMTAEIGLPVARALIAFETGAFDECVRLLRPVRTRAYRFGGSHAQRDVLDQTLIEAARRGGDHRLVKVLASERREARPGDAYARSLLHLAANENQANTTKVA
jgi:hypothetical protein